MKKLFAMFAVAVVFAACGSGETKDAAADSTKLADSIKAADSAKAAAAAADTTKKDSTAAAADTTKK